MRKLLLVAGFLLGGCAVFGKNRDLNLVQDRVQKLKPLSSWRPTQCRVEADLTQPALARYRQMFAGNEDLPWVYTWKARESTCEVRPLTESPATVSHQAFLEASLCLLMQVHYVNSPFDELAVLPNDIVDAGEKVRLRTEGADEGHGIYLNRGRFEVETRTKSRGTLKAAYASLDGEWLPSRIEQRQGTTTFVVDEIEYADARVGSRRQLKSFWIFAGGGEQPIRHSKAAFSECREW